MAGEFVGHPRHRDGQARRAQVVEVLGRGAGPGDRVVLVDGFALHGRGPDRVVAVRDRLDRVHGLHGRLVGHIAGELAHRSLSAAALGRHVALDDDLGTRRNPQVDSFALDHLDRLAE
jgi:hypothetical protein